MDIEEVLEASKPLGRTQVLIIISSCLMQVQYGQIALNIVFISEVPPFWCTASEENGYTSTFRTEGLSLLETNDANWTDSSLCPYEWVDTNGTVAFATSCLTGWTYDTAYYGKSIVSEWDLVCSQDFLPALSQSILMAGFAVGSLMSGPLADISGNLTLFRTWLTIFNIIGITISFSRNFVMFATLRFLLGTFYVIVRFPVLTLQYEYLIPRYRGFIGSIPFVITGACSALLPLCAFYVRDWRYFHLITMVPSIALLFICWFLPASARWYLSHGKIEEAERIIQKVAKFNKAKHFPSPALGHLNWELKMMESQNTETEKKDLPNLSTSSHGTKFIQVFKQPLMMVTVILGFLGLTTELIYYTYPFSAGSLSGDFYLNIFLLLIIDFPGRFLSQILIKRTGGLYLMFAGFILSTVIIVIIVGLSYIDDQKDGISVLIICLAMLGKFVSAACLTGPSYLLQSELFPTQVRNTARGIQQFLTAAGGLTAPLFFYLNRFLPNIAFILMGICCVSATGLCLLLPNAKHAPIPSTIQDLQLLIETRGTLWKRLSAKIADDEVKYSESV